MKNKFILIITFLFVSHTLFSADEFGQQQIAHMAEEEEDGFQLAFAEYEPGRELPIDDSV